MKTIGIKLNLEGGAKAEADIKKVSGSLGGLGNAAASVRSAAAGLIGGLVGAATVREFVQLADAATLMDARLKLATRSASDFAQAQADVYRIAQSNAVEIGSVASLYTKLTDPIHQLGGATAEVAAITEAFALSLKVGGASASEASAATLQFAQAMAAGALRGDEFNSIAEANPRFMKAVAASLGVTTGALREMAQDGKLTADVVGKALIESLSTLRTEGEAIPLTVGAAMTQLKNEVLVLVGAFDKSTGASGSMAQAMASYLSPALKLAFSGAIGLVSVVETLGKVVGGVAALFTVNFTTMIDVVRRVLDGDFSGAWDRVKSGFVQGGAVIGSAIDDITASWERSGAVINSVWGDTSRASEGLAADASRLNSATKDGKDAAKARAAAEKALAAAMRERAAIAQKIAAIETKAIEAASKDVAGLIEGNAALRDEIALIGASEAARRHLVVAKEQDIIATRELDLVMAQNAGQSDAVIAALQQEIALRKQRVQLLQEKGVKEVAQDAIEANEKASKAAQEQWTKTWDSVSQSLTDALMRGFEDGKGFAENFVDSLKNMFKTQLAKALQQSIAQGLSSAFSGQGFNFGSLFGGQGGFNWSSLFSGNNWASTIGSALGYGSSAGAGAGTLTYANAVGAMGGDSLGALAAANNQWAGVAASASEAAAASQSAASASSAAAGAWASWAAVALATSSNMYKAGWNKDAMTEGAIATHRFGRFSSTTGQSQYTSTGQLAETANVITEKINMGILKAVGTSDKWAQILSGVPLTAGVWGRKLKGYGYDIDIAGGAVDVGGYEYHKGGLFRSNKTVGFDVDPRDAEDLRRQVEAVRDSSAAMAKAMGYSDEAIESFTGNLRINFKGAETAAQRSERYSEALNDLNRQMINAATGANYTKEQFADFMGGIQEDMAAVGISAEGIADILVDGIMGRMSASEVGAALSDMIVGGIYESIVGNYAGVIAQTFTSQILTPMFTAMATGVPLSQAVSQAAINNVVATAQHAMATLNAILNSAEIQAAMVGIETAIKGVVGATARVKVPSFGSAHTSASNAAAQKANEIARERYQLETQLLGLLGNTAKLRERELNALTAGNRSLQKHIWAIEDAREGMDGAIEALRRAVEAEQDALNKRLSAARDAESMLNGVFGTLRGAIRDLRGDVTDGLTMQAAQASDVIRQMTLGAQALDPEVISEAVSVLRGSVESATYTSRTDRDRAYLGLAAQLEGLQLGQVQPRLSEAERQIILLEEQLEYLSTQLQVSEDQMNALLGIDTSVKSVTAAVGALGSAMATYTQTVAAAAKLTVSTTPPASTTPSVSVPSYSAPKVSAPAKQWTVDGYWAKNADLRDYWNANKTSLIAQFGGVDQYLKWHWDNYGKNENRKYASGAAFLGGGVVHRPTFFDQALMGEAGKEGILPLASIGGRLGVHAITGGDEEVKRLLRELVKLAHEGNTTAQATAVHTARVSGILRKVTRGGDGVVVVTEEDRPLRIEQREGDVWVVEVEA